MQLWCYFMHLCTSYANILHRKRKMDKEKRQRKLLSLIRARPVSTQGELAERLERAGYVATQSSISRDLEELGVVKQGGRYVVPRAENGAAARGVLGLDAAGGGSGRAGGGRGGGGGV